MAQRGVAVTGTVYQLRVVLAGISPMVWRRLLVPAETSIAGLHAIMQTAFGWSDEHLHRFTIHAVEYGLWRPGSAGFSRDARQVRLASSGCGPASGSPTSTTSSPGGGTTSGWRRSCPARRAAATRPARAGPGRRRRSTSAARRSSWRCGSAGRRCSSPSGWREILADLLDADGDAPAGEAIGDQRDELARLLDLARLDKLDRTALNSALHALDITPESVSDGRQQ